MRKPRRREPAEKRFWRHVHKDDEGCWLWVGARNAAGYGVFCGDGGKPTGAHRFSYQLHFGPLPSGIHVCHRCDNPPCVRPDHLFPGTAGDNMHDRDVKGRTYFVVEAVPFTLPKCRRTGCERQVQSRGSQLCRIHLISTYLHGKKRAVFLELAAGDDHKAIAWYEEKLKEYKQLTELAKKLREERHS